VTPEFISSKYLLSLLKPLTKALKLKSGERYLELEKVNDVFGSSQELARYYVEPNCQHINPADEDEDGAINSIRESLFDYLNRFLKKTIVTKDGSNQLFILADAGMGKSSLMMIFKLMHIMSFLPQQYNCKLLKLGEMTLQDIKKIKNTSNTILLLDSLDEDPLATGTKTLRRVENILDKTKNFYRVIVTCRTQFFPETKEAEFGLKNKVTISSYTCPLVYLSIFDEGQVSEYLIRRYGNYMQRKFKVFKCKKAIRAEKSILSMGSFRFRPFLLAHIEDIFENIENNSSEYKIYEGLIKTWIKREITKLRAQGNNDIQPEDMLKICTLIAEKIYNSNERTISLDEIGKFCHKKSVIELINIPTSQIIESISKIDISSNSLMNKNSEGRYRFSHLTITEFLIVYGIKNSIISGLQRPFKISSKIKGLCESTNFNFDWHFKNAKGGYFLFNSELNDNWLNKDMKNLYLSKSEFNKEKSKYSVLKNLDMNSCTIGFSKFYDGKFIGTNMKSAAINNCEFNDCFFDDTNFSYSDIFFTTFRHCKIDKCNTTAINIMDCDFFDCTFTLNNTFQLHQCILSNVMIEDVMITTENRCDITFDSKNKKIIIKSYLNGDIIVVHELDEDEENTLKLRHKCTGNTFIEINYSKDNKSIKTL